MTRSDKQRITEALARYEARFDRVSQTGTPTDVFAAAADWLRAECKLVDRYLDDHGDGWGDAYVAEVGAYIGDFARKVAGEIRGDLK